MLHWNIHFSDSATILPLSSQSFSLTLYFKTVFLSSPDQLEDVVDEAGPVVPTEHSVIALKLLDQSAPASSLVMDNVIASHVHVKFDPVHLRWQIQHIWRQIPTLTQWEKLNNFLHFTPLSCPLETNLVWFWAESAGRSRSRSCWWCRSRGLAKESFVQEGQKNKHYDIVLLASKKTHL